MHRRNIHSVCQSLQHALLILPLNQLFLFQLIYVYSHWNVCGQQHTEFICTFLQHILKQNNCLEDWLSL